jgi:DNA-binding transcriptional MerR regulator
MHPIGQHTGERGAPMTTPESEEPTLTIDELAARAGVTVRTIRFYGTRGLLPPPAIGPRRIGHYGPGHLSRLALIEELQHHGMTLSAIERYLRQLPADLSADDLAIHRALVASWAPEAPEEATREQLARRAGRELSDEDVDRLAALHALERTDRPDVFRVDPGVLHLGLRLLAVPIDLETILAAHTVVLEHSRSVARELGRLFRDEVWGPEREPESGGGAERAAAKRSLSADMQPLVVQALVIAFQRSMKQELRAWYGTDAD